MTRTSFLGSFHQNVLLTHIRQIQSILSVCGSGAASADQIFGLGTFSAIGCLLVVWAKTTDRAVKPKTRTITADKLTKAVFFIHHPSTTPFRITPT
jgi:hypothetical protein